MATALIGAAAPSAELDVRISGLRDSKGMVMLCLTQRAKFLDCGKDPQRITRIVAPGVSGDIRIGEMATGSWSLLVIHDANRNGRLDTMLGMPTEGFGFSRNPAMRMGPPRYNDVRFALPIGASEQRVTIKYLL